MTEQSLDIDLSQFSTTTTCPICNCYTSTHVGMTPTINPAATLRVGIIRCSQCGHWYTTPTPNQEHLLHLYASGSETVLGEWGAPLTPTGFATLTSTVMNTHWIIKKESQHDVGSYLELGPGDGALLRTFETRGWTCYAVEPGTWTRGHPRIFDRLDKIPRSLKFHVIVANDVLEHVASPTHTVAALSKKLMPGGRFYCSFPNSDSMRAQNQHTSWRMVRPLGHLRYFSRESARKMIQSCGLALESTATYDHLSPPKGQLAKALGLWKTPKRAYTTFFVT